MFHLFGGSQTGALSRFFQFGGYAVDLFFVLSGFILNWVYLAKTPLNWTAYFKARAARILPLYYLTTCLFLPLTLQALGKNELPYGAKEFPWIVVLNLLGVSGLVDGPFTTINGPAWSISVECFCYVMLFPALYFAATIYESSRHRGLLLGCFVGCALAVWLGFYHLLPLNVLGRSWSGDYLRRGVLGFSTGFVLCAVYKKLPDRWLSQPLINVAVAGHLAIFLLVILGVLSKHWVLLAIPTLVFLSATDRGFILRPLKMRIFQWLGERSYSIYLWHLILMELFLGRISRVLPVPVGDVIYCLLVLVVAELSYRFFECPCREYFRKFSFAPANAAAPA